MVKILDKFKNRYIYTKNICNVYEGYQFQFFSLLEIYKLILKNIDRIKGKIDK